MNLDRIRSRLARLGSTVVAGAIAVSVAGTAQAEPGAQAQDPGTQPPPVERRYAPKVLNAQELEILIEVEEDFKRYEGAWNRHQGRIRTILHREYVERKKKLESRFTEKIASAETEERRRHLEAMALLEQFIRDYPDHMQFTPDAMFRLADLYVDEAEYQFDKASEGSFDYEAASAGTTTAAADGEGENADEDAPPEMADYSKALGMWSEIAKSFPEYRQKAGALYLWSYYLKQTGNERKALQVARGLVCNNKYNPMDEPPPPPDREAVRALYSSPVKPDFTNPYADCTPLKATDQLIEEAWVRLVADIHFHTPGELNEAIVSYEGIARNKKSRYYDEALYKLAWSYYRNDDFLKGIRAFDESVVYSDSLVAKGKDPLELRPEAVQYIAISFTDPWSVEEQTDPVKAYDRAMAFYKDRLDEPHVRDVLEQLGETFKILEAWDQGIDSWRLALKHWPLHPKNPALHQNIVTAFEAKGDRDAADDEAARLSVLYAPGTDWYRANEMNREAMVDQQRIGERMLRSAAENTHRAAQQARRDYLFDPSEESKTYYVELYGKAAALYRKFIETYPIASENYEFTYRLAETLFFSEQYMESIAHYRWVRDHRELSELRFEKAARSVVQAYEKEIEQRIAKGEMSQPPVPKVEELRAMAKPIQAKSVPQLYQELRSALDKYQQLINDPKTAPNMALLAGLVSYRHLELDDSIRRFEVVLRRFCGTPEAVQAKDGLLAIYEARGQGDKFKATNQRFISSKCGTDDDILLAKAQNRSREFREAEELFSKKDYDKAAIAFYQYYKTANKTDESLPVALYNSAIAYDRAGKPKTAIYLFDEFTSNKADEYRKSEYYVEALYLTAVAQQKAFDYPGAVDTYLNVVKVASEKGRKQPPGKRSLAQIRLDAYFNAALLRELDRVYLDPRSAKGTGAASLYKRYAQLEPDRRKKDRALWAVARVWESAGNLTAMNRAYADWRKAYGRDKGNADDYVFTYYNMANAYSKKGKSRDAAKYRAETIKAWAAVGKPTGGPAGAFAAEFAFLEAEEFYRTRFEKFKITKMPTTEKKARLLLDQLDALTDQTKAKYSAIGSYKSSFWGQAALVRVGDVLFFSSLKLQQAPVPREVTKLDERFPDKEILLQYEESIENLVKPKTDAAKQQWERVANAGKKAGVSNKWTKLAQERLHDFVSQDDFPVLRDELVGGTKNP